MEVEHVEQVQVPSARNFGHCLSISADFVVECCRKSTMATNHCILSFSESSEKRQKVKLCGEGDEATPSSESGSVSLFIQVRKVLIVVVAIKSN